MLKLNLEKLSQKIKYNNIMIIKFKILSYHCLRLYFNNENLNI